MLVSVEQRGALAVLTLTRHEKRNAISVSLAAELVRALRALGPDTRAVLLTGAGTCFSAGADLSEKTLGGGFFEAFDELVTTLRALSVPVVAYVNGPAIGAGMMLTMACDLRVVSSAASFRIPVGDMAIGVNEWVVTSLADLVGGSRARVMLYTGGALDAAAAADCGYGIPGESIDDAVRLAETVAAKAPLTQRNIKMRFAPDLHTPEELDAATEAPFRSSDIVESGRARAEKRQPRFTGA
ncbi:enoyl-CoA hydratase-related protein [Corynebacterium timonense]|uniref:Enoyl-CoA hydratase n=1 Tax=Corynebacterium timonense TaxID=441500 RepID=A0A1H1L477_9CORY|nr:enoyl-CoA hydratase-related protein [Corynebacterium timonense]SDR68815.1 enoyl-CoA hydratase [Corynebacterium timonense]